MANSKKDEELERINEEEAYFELCQIIAEAVQTQDVNLLKSRIDNWKSKYPWSKFSSNYKSKIQYILNNYYLEITRYINLQIEQKKDFDSRKAYLKLFDIVNETKDLKTLKLNIKHWEKDYPINSFSQKYQDRIKRLTSEKSLNEHALNQEEAFADLLQIAKSKHSFEEFRGEISTWKKEYSIDDKYSIDDFVNNKSEINRITSDDYLKLISTDDFDLQNKACKELSILLSNSNDLNKMIKWAHDYQNVDFDDKHKGLIMQITSSHYPVSFLQYVQKSPISLSGEDLSFDEFKSIDVGKKYAIVRFLSSIASPSGLSTQNIHDFNTVYRKSEKAKRITIISETVDKFKDLKSNPKTLVEDTVEKFETPYSIIVPLSPNVSGHKKADNTDIFDKPKEVLGETVISEPIVEPKEKVKEPVAPEPIVEPKEKVKKSVVPEPIVKPKGKAKEPIVDPKEKTKRSVVPKPDTEQKDKTKKFVILEAASEINGSIKEDKVKSHKGIIKVPDYEEDDAPIYFPLDNESPVSRSPLTHDHNDNRPQTP